MSTSALFHRLIDDAAVFPPGNAQLSTALSDHRAYLQQTFASVVGPLLMRDVDVTAAAAAAAGPMDSPMEMEMEMEMGIVGTSGAAGIEAAFVTIDSLDLSVDAVELPVAASDDLHRATKELVAAVVDVVPAGVSVSIELPHPGRQVTRAWLAAADEVSAAGWQNKFRTGGVVPTAYPDEVELAGVLGALTTGGHAFKLTAGLHRAVRNTQADTDFEQHGFLNVMVAVHLLAGGSSEADAVEVLASRDGQYLAGVIQSWTDHDIERVRGTFRSFGSCSIVEPYTDLVELGLCA